ncbi:MAG: cytochrome c [bacterium]|nr:cytochrome c [bacterium]
MKIKYFTGLALFSLMMVASCGGEAENAETGNNEATSTEATPNADPTADDSKGVGKFTSVELAPNLDQKLADAGKGVYDMKCGACHRLTEVKLVGPGWKGVTSRRKPEWIMNFSTNPEEMLSKDASAMAMLEECLVKMPNQNLSDEDARNVLEFMRSNDGVK